VADPEFDILGVKLVNGSGWGGGKIIERDDGCSFEVNFCASFGPFI